MKKIIVRTRLLTNGFDTLVDDKSYPTIYPKKIWKNFPSTLKSDFAETAAYFFTNHFVIYKNYSIEYLFPPPFSQSLFFQGLLYSLPETTIALPEYKHTTSKLIKKLFNNSQRISFQGFPRSITDMPDILHTPNIALIPFTFGKDSLLTFAVAREIGLTPKLFFVEEPLSPYENIPREKIYKKFEKESNQEVIFFSVNLGNLRQKTREMWGWDMLQLQYALLLIPYLYSSQARYLLFSNERNTNEWEFDKEGFYSNIYFEQNSQWMPNANNLLRIFGLNTLMTSIVSPLYEFTITYILHRRYSNVGSYQISCCGDSKKAMTNRWCGVCVECSRMYLFLLAIGIDPRTLGFTQDMLRLSKKNLFHIFSEKEKQEKGEAVFIEYYGEWMLAFYLSYKRGARGELVELFKKNFLSQVQRKLQKLINKYLNVYEDKTVPIELRSKVYAIYQSEVDKFKEEITALI